MWGGSKIIWRGGPPEGKGRGAVNSNNEILPDEEFRQKRFHGGYAKRCGEWNRVVYDPVVIEPPEIERKEKEGWLFVCGWSKSSYTTSWGETFNNMRPIGCFSGELDYDAINEIFTDKWYPSDKWALSDSIVSRRLSENTKDVGKTFVDANCNLSVYYEIRTKLDNYRYFNAISVFPRGFPYIKRFEYQSLTKSSLDQASPFKRNTEYYSKAFTELYETPRQNLDDLYNSLESYENKNNNGSTGQCSNCGFYYSSNDDIEDLMSDPANLINRNVSAYNFILHSIDHEENKKVTNQACSQYVNLEEFNFRPVAAALNYKLDKDAKTYEYILYNGWISGMFTFREVYYGSDPAHEYGKSTLIENSDITKYEYDWRLYYYLTANFYGYDINNIITSTWKKEFKTESVYFGYDQGDKKTAITLKDYVEKNTFAYYSYLNFYNSDVYGGLPKIIQNARELLQGYPLELVKNFPKTIMPPTVIEETQYYDPNAVTFHNCKAKNPYGGGKYGGAFTSVFHSGNVRRVAFKQCPDKDQCIMWRHDVSGSGHTYVVPGDIYVCTSGGLGSDYNKQSYSKAGVDRIENQISSETETYEPEEDILNEYNQEQEESNEDYTTSNGSNDVFAYPENITEPSGIYRTIYIPKTFYSTRIYLKEGTTKKINSTSYDGNYTEYSESYEITGTEIDGYKIKKTIKKLASQKTSYNDDYTSDTYLVDDNGNQIGDKYNSKDFSNLPNKIIGNTMYVPKLKLKQIYNSDGTSKEEVESVEYVPADTMQDIYNGGSVENGWTNSQSGYFNESNSNLNTGYSSTVQYDYVRKKGRPYEVDDFPPIARLFSGLFVDFLSSSYLNSYPRHNKKFVYYEFPTETDPDDENNPSLFTKKTDKNNYSGTNYGGRNYDCIIGEISGTPGTSWFAFPCNSAFEGSTDGNPIVPSWGSWWIKLGCPNANVTIIGPGVEYLYTSPDGTKYYGSGGRDEDSGSDYYVPNEDLKNNEKCENLISNWDNADIPSAYFLFPDYYLSPLIYNVSRFLLASRDIKFILDANIQPSSMLNDNSNYYGDCNFILAPWERSQVTIFGCTPDGEDKNGIKYNNKYFIFNGKDEYSGWQPTKNQPKMQNRFYTNGTAYKNYLVEGVYPSGDTDTFVMVNAWMTDIEEGFSGIELKVEGFTNLADGKCTTGFNVPCDTAMISTVSLEDLSIKQHANVFTKDDANGYTTNKGIFPVLKSLWQQRKTDGSYGDKMAIFAIETQCMIEGPEYYFSSGPNELPPGFEQGYEGYLSRGLLISVASGGTFTNYFVDKKCGFFDYFKEQNKKRYPINARRAYDDEPEDMRKEVGYYWDFEEAFGPYEIGSPYTFETQLAGKMSFAVTLGDRTTHILFMLAYDIDKWPTLSEDTPTEYKHPEIKPEEEYSFRAAFLTAELNFGVTAEPKIPNPFQDFQIQKTLRPLVTNSRDWTTSKLKNAKREFFVDDEEDEDATDFGDKGYKGNKKEYEGITIPKSMTDKKWGERVFYEFDEKDKTLEDLKINRGVIRLVRWRTYTWKEKKVDKNGDLVKDNDGKQKYIEHQDAIAECAVAYTDGQTTKPDNDYVDLFYTGKDTILLRFYRDDSKLETKKKKNAVEGEDYKNVEICVGDVCVENMAIPELMVWQKMTKGDTGKVSASKDYLLKLSKLGIFDVITLQQASEEEDPDESFEVLAIPVVATAAYDASNTKATSKTYFCVSKDCKNWEITGVIGDGFLSHTAAGDKSTAPAQEEETK